MLYKLTWSICSIFVKLVRSFSSFGFIWGSRPLLPCLWNWHSGPHVNTIFSFLLHVFFCGFPFPGWASQGAQWLKNAGDTGHSVRSLGQEDLLEKEMATYCSISCLGNPMDRGASRATVHEVTKSWTQLSPHALEKGFPGSASSQEPACQPGQQKRRCFYPWVGKIPWSRKWQPTPVFLPGESHGQESLASWVHIVANSWHGRSDLALPTQGIQPPEPHRAVCLRVRLELGMLEEGVGLLLSRRGACKALLVPTAATDILALRNLQTLQR